LWFGSQEKNRRVFTPDTGDEARCPAARLMTQSHRASNNEQYKLRTIADKITHDSLGLTDNQAKLLGQTDRQCEK
jgi:hypothetical protein